jgi:hypothetical protein
MLLHEIDGLMRGGEGRSGSGRESRALTEDRKIVQSGSGPCNARNA